MCQLQSAVVLRERSLVPLQGRVEEAKPQRSSAGAERAHSGKCRPAEARQGQHRGPAPGDTPAPNRSQRWVIAMARHGKHRESKKNSFTHTHKKPLSSMRSSKRGVVCVFLTL